MSAQYFAQLDENNIVLTVHVVTAEFMAENPERYLGVWVETFVDKPNKQYAAVGYTYDYETENFVAPSVIPIVPNDEQ
jgi:hypothetical protein